jgi:hypothetical protein
MTHGCVEDIIDAWDKIRVFDCDEIQCSISGRNRVWVYPKHVCCVNSSPHEMTHHQNCIVASDYLLGAFGRTEVGTFEVDPPM